MVLVEGKQRHQTQNTPALHWQGVPDFYQSLNEGTVTKLALRLLRRRVGKLFAGGRYFLCRHCYNVAYTSQSEARHDCLLRRANKLRMSLVGEPGTASWIAPKPKGMWRRTYQRKRFEIQWCEDQANQVFLSKYRHVLSDDELRMYFDT